MEVIAADPSATARLAPMIFRGARGHGKGVLIPQASRKNMAPV
jgi:hypothetical protein